VKRPKSRTNDQADRPQRSDRPVGRWSYGGAGDASFQDPLSLSYHLGGRGVHRRKVMIRLTNDQARSILRSLKKDDGADDADHTFIYWYSWTDDATLFVRLDLHPGSFLGPFLGVVLSHQAGVDLIAFLERHFRQERRFHQKGD
jgi:hypothetical protein